jgi:hypothetical protein
MKIFVVSGLFISTICLSNNAYAQESPQQNLYGNWQIVAYRFGDGISVGPREARRLLGKKISFSSGRAVSGREVCAQPVYESKRLDVEQFLREFKTSPKSIGIKRDYIDVLNVHCGGTDWTVPGSLLLKIPNGQILTMWDGVFFVLKKQSSRG